MRRNVTLKGRSVEKKNEVQNEKKKKRPKKRKFQPHHIEHRKAIAEHN